MSVSAMRTTPYDSAEIAEAPVDDSPSTPSTTDPPPSESVWQRLSRSLSKTWDAVEINIADFFGLNESRYQWAVDEHRFRQHQALLDGFGMDEAEIQLATREAAVMNALEEQRMNRIAPTDVID